MTGQQPGPRIDIEDFGPALDAIAQHAYGDQWTALGPGRRAEAKQQLLDLLIPGVQIVLDQANEQIAHTTAVLGEQREAVLKLHERADLPGAPYCRHCESVTTRVPYPCPTARALGVTE